MLERVMKMYKGLAKTTGFMKHYLTLFAVVEGMEAKDTFEFGTGVSTQVILDAKGGEGHHNSCDLRPIEQTGLDPSLVTPGTWTYHKMDSKDFDFKSLPALDFVLHDGSHIASDVERDLINILPYMKQGSILMVHDTNNKYELDKSVETALYSDTFEKYNRVSYDKITLPYGYGLTMIEVMTDFGNGKVDEPTWRK